MKGQRLNTVCEEAACPNRGECWSRGTATIMIMGDTCTRSCGFCNVKTGRPEALDPEEPRRVAEAIRAMGLKYTVITSVDRDELPDTGAGHFAETIRAVHALNPQCRVEVLTPDFKGIEENLKIVCDAQPDVFAHNMETVARLHLDGAAAGQVLAQPAGFGAREENGDGGQVGDHGRPRRNARRKSCR